MKNSLKVALLFLLPMLARANVTSVVDKSGPFLISGLPQTISVGFPFQASGDLLVLDAGSTGAPRDPAVALTLGSDYLVTGGNYNGANQMQVGSVQVLAGGSNLVLSGDTIVIKRNVALNQITSFSATGPLTINLIEQALDKMATLSQQVNEIGGRSLQFENFEFLSPTLSLANRKGTLLGFDANGNVAFVPSGTVPTGYVSQIVAGANVTISPSGGTGAVTVNASGASAGGSPGQVQWNSAGALAGLSSMATNGYNVGFGTGSFSSARGITSTYSISGQNPGVGWYLGDTFTATTGSQSYEEVLLTPSFATGGFADPFSELILGTPSITGGSASGGYMLNIQAPGTGMTGAINVASGAVNLGTGLTTVAALTATGTVTLPSSLVLTNGTTATTQTTGDISSKVATDGFVISNFAIPPGYGSTTPNTVAATTLAASSTVSGTGFTNLFASPPALGSTTANTGAFTTLTSSSSASIKGAFAAYNGTSGVSTGGTDWAGATGSEVQINESAATGNSNTGQITAYGSGGSAYAPLTLDGLQLNLQISGTTAATLGGTGVLTLGEGGTSGGALAFSGTQYTLPVASIAAHPVYGLALIGKTGSTYDLTLCNGSGIAALGVLPGTLNVQVAGRLYVGAGLVGASTQGISALAIDWSVSNSFSKTLAANSTFTFSNAADGITIIVALTNTASNYTVTWPTVKWAGGTAPTQTIGAHTDVYTFVDIGGTIYGSVVQNF